MDLSNRTVIVDIDGTVSTRVNRGIYDYDMVHEDQPIQNVVDLVQMLHKLGVKLIFCSGREDSCLELTRNWLICNIFPSGLDGIELFMRETGDNRPDDVVKEEIYKYNIEPNHNVWFVLDDRQKVVDKWREMGLTCLQVAPGNF